jgi:hypothetical protein
MIHAYDERRDTGPLGQLNKIRWLVVLFLTLAFLMIVLTRGCIDRSPPVISYPDDALTGEITLTGTAPADSTVEVTLDDQLFGRAQADAEGNWSMLGFVEPEGNYSTIAQTFNSNGTEMAASEPEEWLVKRRPEPLLTGMPDFQNPIISADYELDAILLWNGTGDFNGTVDILDNETKLGTADIDANGNWAFSEPVTLASGPHTLVARMYDVDGEFLEEAVDSSVELPDLAAMFPPLTIEADVDAETGTVRLFGSTGSGTPLEVLREGEPVTVVAADADGNWEYIGVEEPGDYEYGVRYPAEMVGDSPLTEISAIDVTVSAPLASPTIGVALNPDGGIALSGAAESGEALTLTLDEEESTVSADADGMWLSDGSAELGAHNAVLRYVDGVSEPESVSADYTVLRDSEAGAADPELVLVSRTDDGIQLAGTAAAGEDIEILVAGEGADLISADTDGLWQTAVDLTPGTYVISVRRTVTEDGTTARVSAAQIEIDDEGNVNAVPALDLTGIERTGATLTGSGEPGAEIEILVDGELIGTATVDDAGNWVYEGDLPETGDTVTIRYSSISGELTTPPTIEFGGQLETPTISFGQQFLTAEGLSLSGTAAPSSTLELTLDDAVAETVTTDADGNWATVIGLEPGARVVSVQYVPDEAGESAGKSRTLTFAVPLNDSNIIVPTLQLTDDATGDTVVIQGTAAPNTTLDIIVNGESVGTARTDADGNWSYVLDSADTEAGAESAVFAQYIDDVDAGDTPITIETSNNGALQLLFADSETSTDSASDEATGAAAGEPVTMIIFDASWSMQQELGNSTRIDVARDALTRIVTEILPEGSPIALRAFGNVEGNLSCRTDLMIPVSPLDRTEATAVIANLEPQFLANTAIGASLDAALADLSGTEGEKRLILLTDGEETCGGDPEAAIQALRDAGIDVTVDVVGFAIEDQALKDEFATWAEVGGGAYYDAESAEDLLFSLASSTALRYQVLDSDGNVVAEGAVGGPPVTLPPGDYTVVLTSGAKTTFDNVAIDSNQATEIVVP